MGFRRRKKEGRGTRERATTTRAVASVPEQGDFALVYGGYISWPRPWNRPPFLGSRRISALPLLFILAFVSFLPLLFIRITIYISSFSSLPPVIQCPSKNFLSSFFPPRLPLRFGYRPPRQTFTSPLSLPFLSLLLISLSTISSNVGSDIAATCFLATLSLHLSPSLPSRFTHLPHTSSLSLSPSPRVVGLICETAVPGIHPRLGLSFIAASPLLFLRHY